MPTVALANSLTRRGTGSLNGDTLISVQSARTAALVH